MQTVKMHEVTSVVSGAIASSLGNLQKPQFSGLNSDLLNQKLGKGRVLTNCPTDVNVG